MADPDARERTRLPSSIRACLLDLDGVLTRTAELHALAWQQTFDAYLQQRADAGGEAMRRFDAVGDYEAYVDGRPRYDGVRAFLASRGIVLAEGTPGDPPSATTVHGLGNRKNAVVGELMRERGVRVFEGSVRFVRIARREGLRCALVTSSENAEAVLAAAGLTSLFDAQVDGRLAGSMGLAGKPAPDVFLEGARRVDVPPAEAAVFEDAAAGVAAGRAGAFGLVVGVDRGAHAAALRAAGADVVVRDLSELLEPA